MRKKNPSPSMPESPKKGEAKESRREKESVEHGKKEYKKFTGKHKVK